MKINPLIFRIGLGIGVLLLAIISALPLIPPRTVSADAPSTRFSAERPMTDLAVIAKEPHGQGYTQSDIFFMLDKQQKSENEGFFQDTNISYTSSVAVN